jgi:hypothetical protein
MELMIVKFKMGVVKLGVKVVNAINAIGVQTQGLQLRRVWYI